MWVWLVCVVWLLFARFPLRRHIVQHFTVQEVEPGQTVMESRHFLKVERLVLQRKGGVYTQLSASLAATNLSEDEVSYLVVDESALGEVYEPVTMEIWVPVVQECQV